MPCLVVLVGPSGSGKSTWAAGNFAPDQIVSSDRLRAMVGLGEHDQQASRDAFELLFQIVERRLRRGLTTVVDTLGLDDETRERLLGLARAESVPAYAIGFDTPAKVCRQRNRARERPVPAKVLSAQISRWSEVKDRLVEEGFVAVRPPGRVRLLPPALVESPHLAERQSRTPLALDFGLQIPSFTWDDGPAAIGPYLRDIARAAEAVGFSSLWVMDHFLQIPMVGPEWHDMLDSYTTLGFLAAHTRRVRLGVLVTGVTYRNPAHLGKIVATLDVLSEGRAVCGLGLGWFEREHRAYGWEFPDRASRYALLEDTLQLLPLLWGPGSPSFRGKVLSVPEAICYPRPLQEQVPILIGGSGERKTLRLVARYADACNLFGDAATVGRKLEVLAAHCLTFDRDPAEIEVTHLGTALVASSPTELAAEIDRLRPRSSSAEAYAARVNAGTAADQVGRYRELAEAGVQTAIVNFPDLTTTRPIEHFAEVIAAFPSRPGRLGFPTNVADAEI